MNSEPAERVTDALTRLGGLDDYRGSLGEAALLLAALIHPGLSLERYKIHLEKISADVAERHAQLCAAGAEENAETQLAALKHTIVDKYAYHTDREQPDHIQNADLVRVIDRGAGGPVALGILYIVAGRAQGWDIDGLRFPGGSPLRIAYAGQRVIFDPSQDCRILQAPDLRRLLKETAGEKAELSAVFFEPAADRDILIRLQNIIKRRQIESEDYGAALTSVEAMRAVAPDEYRLLLDAGVLYARTGNPQEAVTALEQYIAIVPPGRDRDEASYLLEEIRLALKD